MKRDWKTIRQVLQNVEAGTCQEYPFANDHVALLIQAKLLTGTPTQTFGQTTGYQDLTLTWHGHDFLDLARDDARWTEAMAVVEEKQGISFDMLMGLLKSLAGKTVLR